MIIGLLLAVQILISVAMVVSILLQSSKGGGLAGIAGGLSSSTVFGGRGAANFLTKSTTVLATLFFMNCLGMAMITAHTDALTSVTQQAVRGEAPVSPVPQIPGGQTININQDAAATATDQPTATVKPVDAATTPAPTKSDDNAGGDGN